jgi:hypothetical protein
MNRVQVYAKLKLGLLPLTNKVFEFRFFSYLFSFMLAVEI